MRSKEGQEAPMVSGVISSDKKGVDKCDNRSFRPDAEHELKICYTMSVVPRSKYHNLEK